LESRLGLKRHVEIHRCFGFTIIIVSFPIKQLEAFRFQQAKELIQKTVALEILNPKLILKVLNKLPISFIPSIINFASIIKPFTFVVIECIAAIIFTFR